MAWVLQGPSHVMPGVRDPQRSGALPVGAMSAAAGGGALCC